MLCASCLEVGIFDYSVTLIKSPGPNPVDADESAVVIIPVVTRIGHSRQPPAFPTRRSSDLSNDTVKVLAVRTAGSVSSVVGLQLLAPDGTALGVDERSEDAVAIVSAHV